MWTRAELKTRAKAILKLNYWKAFLVSLVLVIVGGGSGGSSGRSSAESTSNYYEAFNGNVWPVAYIIFIGLVIALAAILFRVLIGYALEVGARRFFVQSAQMDINMGYLGYSFKRERYGSIILTMLYKGVLNFLWYLLLIIPGIIKAYAYSMVPYILADNPQIGYSRAVELSNRMTDNQKFDMFVLDLSFLGWYILGSLLFGIGVLFVEPYRNATLAELYLVLKQNALDNGLCSYDELHPIENI